MKKINNVFAPSATDARKAMAHTRAMARKAPYDGTIECWFDPEAGRFLYVECVGSTYSESESLQYIGSAPCQSWH